MATYDMSDDELDRLISIKSKPIESLTDAELGFREAMALKIQAKSEAPTMGDYGKAALSAVGETLAVPGRAGRALGVGLQTGSMDKAKEAFAPDYQAVEGERTGAGVGRAVGEIAGLAAGGAILKAPKAAGMAYNLGRGAVEGAVLGGSEAASQSSGDPLATIKGAGAGAVGGLLGSAAAESIAAIARGVGGALRGTARAGVAPGALETLAAKSSAGELRAGAGTVKQIEKKAQSLIDTATKSRSKATIGVNQARTTLGLPSKTDQAVEEFLNQTGESAQSLAASVAERIKTPRAMDPRASLEFLDALKTDLDKLITWGKANATLGGADKASPIDVVALRKLRGQIVEEITGIPLPGVKELRAAETHFSEIADSYATLYNHLKTPGSAQELLKEAGAAGLRPAGKLSDVQKAVSKLNAGRAYNAGKKAAAALELRKIPSGITAGAAEGIAGPSGRLTGYKAGQALVGAGEKLAKSKFQIPVRVVGKSLAETITERRRKQ